MPLKNHKCFYQLYLGYPRDFFSSRAGDTSLLAAAVTRREKKNEAFLLAQKTWPKPGIGHEKPLAPPSLRYSIVYFITRKIAGDN